MGNVAKIAPVPNSSKKAGTDLQSMNNHGSHKLVKKNLKDV